MTDFSSIIKTAGLSESEAKTYLASLQIGTAPANILVSRVKFSRPATYAAIEALIKKGLLSSQKRGKRRFYTAEPPERLVSYAESQAKLFNDKIKDLAALVQDLKYIQHGERPTVRFYEGLEGLKSILQEIVSDKPEVTLEIANMDAVSAVLSPTERQAVQKILIKNKSRGRAFLSGEVAKVRPGVKVRILPKDSFSFFGDLVIFGDKIAMVTFKDKIIGAVVENKILADTWRVLFELAWKGAADCKEVG